MKYKFTSAEFLLKEEKEVIIEEWIDFLKSNCREIAFTDNIYKHLSLHCGFIAHYNIHGFYAEYFNGDYKDLERFFDNIESWGDYKDITDAMLKEFSIYKDDLFNVVGCNIDKKFELVKDLIRRAETDIDFRREIINKLLG